jgi:ring-1,2-phenylacetyl-CoA epoxidase subunit PaaE
MSKFYSIPVKEIIKETSDCVSIAFNIPENLKSTFQYKQGQYVTIRIQHNGEEIRRSYSICSSPFDGSALRVAAKKVKDGRMSVYLNDTLKGTDSLELMPPMGTFYSELSATNTKNYVLIAGGSGITPMLSIMKSVLSQEPKSTIVLMYGNLSESQTIFKKEIDALANANSERVKVVYVFEKPEQQVADLNTGILTEEKILSIIENYVGLNLNNEFFICGPTPMMQNAEKVLKETLKQSKERVHLEYFTAAEPITKAAHTGEVVMSSVKAILDGDEYEFDLASNGKSILDAAMDADMDAPYSCKGAVCCTCRAKVIEGKVRMDANYALTDEEVAEGYVLTCQSHPLTEKVVVDFDAI